MKQEHVTHYIFGHNKNKHKISAINNQPLHAQIIRFNPNSVMGFILHLITLY